MVERILRFLGRETKGLHEAAYLLALFAFFSQILAFVRDRLLAHIFGASSELDIYYAAFRVPDFIFVLVASIVSVSVLVPFIVERETQGKEEVKKFVDGIFSFFAILVIATCLLAYILMPQLAGVLYKGFTPEALEKVVRVARLLLLSPILLGFSNLLGSLTQAVGRFAVFALAPLLYNVGIILGIIVFAEKLGAFGVALGVILGAVLHVLIQAPFVIKDGLFPSRFSFNLSSVKRVATLSIPRTLTLSTNHIAIIALISFASLMAVGSVSILSLSINLQSVPLTIVGVSYSLAAFPTLTRFFSEKNMEAFLEQISSTARHIIFWALPLTILFVVLRAQIVRVLLGTGQFGWEETRLTAAALAILVVSAVFQSLIVLFMRAFYSAGYTKKPFYINFFSTAVLVVATYLLIKAFSLFEGFRIFFGELLRVGDITDTAVLMLPLGYSLGMILNGSILWISLEKEFGGFSKRIWRTVFESVGASLIMGLATYIGLVVLAPLLKTDTFLGIFTQGLLAGILGILVWALVLWALGSRELLETWKALTNRFWRAKVIGSDPEIV